MLFTTQLRCLWLGALGCAASIVPVRVQGEDAAPLLTRTAPWTTVFAEEELKLQFKSAVAPPVKGRLLWGLSTSDQLSLLKGEVRADGAEMLDFAIKFPSVKPGVVLSTQLTMHLYREGEREPAASYESPIHVFPRDPFADRKETLKKLGVKLYDPAGDTAKVLTAAEFPFEPVFNVAAIGELKEGLLLIGEGVSFRNDRSLPELLTLAAGRGVPILCLAPAAGEFELPRASDEALRGLSLQKNSFVRQLDKRFDDNQWLTQPVVARHSLQPSGRGANISLEVAAGNEGWRWLELQFAHSKLVVVAIPLIEHWEAGPTPRFLFSRLIDHVTLAPDSIPEKVDAP